MPPQRKSLKPPHRPPTGSSAVQPSPAQRRDIAIASAAQAFAVLCEELTEFVEMATNEYKEQAGITDTIPKPGSK